MKKGYFTFIKHFPASTRKGYTLIELLLYMAILSIILLSLTQILISALDIQLETQSSTTLDQDSRYLFARLAYDITRADTIVVPATLGQTANSLQLTAGGETITYALNGTDIEYTDSIGTERMNGYNTNATSLSFQRLGNPSGKPSITISLALQSKTLQSKGQQTQIISTTISTR